MDREELIKLEKLYIYRKRAAAWTKLKQSWFDKGSEAYMLYGRVWAVHMNHIKRYKKILQENNILF